MLITAITPQKKRKDRFNIFVDGKYSFALDAETLLKHNLKKNLEVTPEFIQKLIKDSEFAKWYNQALMLISRRPRSIKEISDYLVRKEIGEQIVTMIVEKLANKNFLNDEDFARWFVEQRLAFRPKGKRMLQLELRQKGIDNEIIEKVLGEAVTSKSEFKQALTIACKKVRPGSVFDLDLKKKLYGFLGRRGFSWDTIEAVWRELKAQK